MQHPKQRKQYVEKPKSARQDLSVPEKLLWDRLKPSVSFQFNIKPKHLLLDKYMVDFFCTDLHIAFEIEGGASKTLSEDATAARYQELQALGVTFVELPVDWVKRNPNQAAEFVLDMCKGIRTIDELG